MKYFKSLVILFSVMLAGAVVHVPAAAEFTAIEPTTPASETTLDDFDKLLAEAYTLYTQAKFKEALAACQKAAALRPTDNRPWAISGIVLMAQRKFEEASAVFALAIRFSSGNEKLHYMKARADRFRNAKEEGLASVRKAIDLNPNFAEAYLLLGDLLGIGGGNDAERTAAFRKAIELDPKLLEAYKYLGMQLEGKKDEKGAEEAYRTAMDVDPKKMAGRFDLGRMLVKQGRIKEARELWNARSSDEDKTFPNFIVVLERAERLQVAKSAYEKNPNDAEFNLQMGIATMDGDHWVVDGTQERAIVFFRKALQINPGFAKAQYAVCKAYVQIADTYKAENKALDEELAKLRKLDATLADEIVAYRKTYSGGFQTVGPPPAKKPS